MIAIRRSIAGVLMTAAGCVALWCGGIGQNSATAGEAVTAGLLTYPQDGDAFTESVAGVRVDGSLSTPPQLDEKDKKVGRASIRATLGTDDHRWASMLIRFPVFDSTGYESFSFWVKTEDTDGKFDVICLLQAKSSFKRRYPAVSVEKGQWTLITVRLDRYQQEGSADEFDPTAVDAIVIGADNTYNRHTDQVWVDGLRFNRKSNAAEIPMNGRWEFLAVKGERLSQASLPESGWEMIPVPGNWRTVTVSMELAEPEQTYRWNKLDSAWYRRNFVVPDHWRGKRVKVAFDGVNFLARVFCNGTFVGEHFSPAEPFTLDLTAHARYDGENTLLVEVLPEGRVEGNQARVGSGIGPGFWQGVRLFSTPAVNIRSMQVETSLQQKRLTVRALIANDGEAEAEAALSPVVLDPVDLSGTVLELPQQRAMVPAGGVKEVLWQQEWNTPRLWSPSDPHLYTLQINASSSSGLAQSRTRFGFREFRVDNGAFFLNGQRIRLRGDTIHSPLMYLQNPASIRAFLRFYKSTGANCLRAWGPFPGVFFDVADEEGFLLHSEFDPIVQKWVESERMHQVAREMVTQWVQANRNHPSIIFWTAENEAVISKEGSPEKFEAMRRLFQVYKTLDPSRLLQAEGDPCMAEAPEIDIYNYHDYSDMRTVPLTHGQRLPASRPPLYGKPLMIGEAYLGYFGRVGWSYQASYYLGERMWRDPAAREEFSGMYKQRALEAWRIRGVNAIQPLGRTTLFEPTAQAESKVCVGWASPEGPYPQIRQLDTDGWRNTLIVNPGWFADVPEAMLTAEGKRVRSAYQPVIVTMAEDWEWGYYAGETVGKTAYAINDSTDQRALTLDFVWKLREGSETVLSGTEKVTVAGAQSLAMPFKFTLPADTGQRRNMQLEVLLVRDNSAIAVNRYRLDVFPARKPLTLPGTIGLYDPKGQTRAVLRKTGLQVKDVELAEGTLDGIDLLILGQCALRREMTEENQLLAQYLEKGGRMVVFEQESGPGFLSWPLRLSEQGGNFVFLRSKENPQFRHFADEDLQFWRGEKQLNTLLPNMVTSRPFFKPAVPGNYQTIVDCGPYLENAAVLEVRQGKGIAFLSQLDLTGRYGVDPVATEFAEKLLQAAASAKPTQWKQVCMLTAKTEAVGPAGLIAGVRPLAVEELRTLPASALLILGSNLSAASVKDYAADLARFVEEGGTILCLRQQKGFDYSFLPQGKGVALSSETYASDLLQDASQEVLAGISLCDLSVTAHEKEKNVAEYKYVQKRKFSGPNVDAPLVAWSDAWTSAVWPAELVMKKGSAPRLRQAREKSLLLVSHMGKGTVLLCQFPFDKLNDEKAAYVLGSLLTNLGAALKPAAVERKPQAQADVKELDLTGYQWRFRIDAQAQGEAAGWASADLNDDGWDTIEVPGFWEQKLAYANLDGYAWYRVHVRVPDGWKGKDLQLSFAGIDDCDWTYFNGALVGKSTREEYPDGSYYKVARHYRIPAASVLADRENTIAVRVWDQWADGGIHKGPITLAPAN